MFVLLMMLMKAVMVVAATGVRGALVPHARSAPTALSMPGLGQP
jgi:hypothetical protein